MASLADAELDLVHGGKLRAGECPSIVRMRRDESSWTVVQSKFHKATGSRLGHHGTLRVYRGLARHIETLRFPYAFQCKASIASAMP